MSLLSVVRLVQTRLWERRVKRELRKMLAVGEVAEIARSDWPRSLSDPTSFYEDCVRYFHGRLPEELREHRAYFTQEFRGFGEDAFHVMWYLLFREFKPRNFLEIGVYRGQTLSLAALLQQLFACQGNVMGVSPFGPIGHPVYPKTINYLEDTLQNFEHWKLPKPILVQALSTDAIAKERIKQHRWDCAYIDGNHDYEVVLDDWETCSGAVVPGGLIVLDDAALTTPYAAPSFATAGYPGPSRFASELKRSNEFVEILQVGHNRVFQKQPAK